jgi:hypothetical protein
MMREDDPPGTQNIRYYRADSPNRGENPILKAGNKKSASFGGAFRRPAMAGLYNIINSTQV